MHSRQAAWPVLFASRTLRAVQEEPSPVLFQNVLLPHPHTKTPPRRCLASRSAAQTHAPEFAQMGREKSLGRVLIPLPPTLFPSLQIECQAHFLIKKKKIL